MGSVTLASPKTEDRRVFLKLAYSFYLKHLGLVLNISILIAYLCLAFKNILSAITMYIVYTINEFTTSIMPKQTDQTL